MSLLVHALALKKLAWAEREAQAMLLQRMRLAQALSFDLRSLMQRIPNNAPFWTLVPLVWTPTFIPRVADRAPALAGVLLRLWLLVLLLDAVCSIVDPNPTFRGACGN